MPYKYVDRDVLFKNKIFCFFLNCFLSIWLTQFATVKHIFSTNHIPSSCYLLLMNKDRVTLTGNRVVLLSKIRVHATADTQQALPSLKSIWAIGSSSFTKTYANNSSQTNFSIKPQDRRVEYASAAVATTATETTPAFLLAMPFNPNREHHYYLLDN